MTLVILTQITPGPNNQLYYGRQTVFLKILICRLISNQDKLMLEYRIAFFKVFRLREDEKVSKATSAE